MTRLRVVVLACLLAGAGVLQAGRAQSIPPKGTASTFDVATWNIEWFGSTSNGPSDEEQQLENVRRVITESGIDLWAVQEIDDEDHFESLIAALGPDYDGSLGGASTNIKVGFIYKRSVVDPIQVHDSWLLQFRDEFAGRPPLLMLADIILPDTTVELYLVSLHMKCCGSQSDFERRSDASKAIKNRIDALHTSDPFIILGDFNDELSGSISGSNPTPYENFLSDAERYRFTSVVLDENDEETWCGNASCSSGSILDHVLVTDELFDAYVEGSTDRYEELLDVINAYTSSTSDHLPVFARFAFPPNTAVEEALRETFRLGTIHPNPVSTTAHLEFHLPKSAWVDISIYDALGREAKTFEGSYLAAGGHRTEIALGDLAAGIYFVRLDADERSDVKPLLISR